MDVELGVYGMLSVYVTEARLTVLYDSSSVKASCSRRKKGWVSSIRSMERNYGNGI